MTLYPGRVTKDFAAMGVEIPGLAELDKVNEAMFEAANAKPADELTDEIAAGSITPKNAAGRLLETATQQAAAAAAQEVYRAAVDAISRRTRAAVHDAAPVIIEHLRPKFDEAAAQLTDTANVTLPPERKILTDPQAALVHARRHEAAIALSAIAAIRTSLATDYGLGSREVSGAWFVSDADDLDADRLGQATRLGRDWMGLVQAGFELRLNDPEESDQIEINARQRSERRRAMVDKEGRDRNPRLRAGRLEVKRHQELIEAARADG